MGILLMYRNLLSKSKSKLPCISHSSSSINLCFHRRIFSEAAAHAPSTVVGDMKPNNTKPMFLINHVHEGINNIYSLLSVADENKHHRICSPFSGRPAQYDPVGSCKEWILFWSHTDDKYAPVGSWKEWIKQLFRKPLFHHSEGELTLWNPTTNRIKTLPPSLLPRDRFYRTYGFCFGFGFDPKSQDYKLFRGLKHEYGYDSDDDEYGSDDEGEVDIELYSLKTDSWKQITAPPDVTDFSSCYNHCVHINGVIYWNSTRTGYNASYLFIRSFDFANEKFSGIPLPDTHSDHKKLRNNYCLAEFHGSLAIVVRFWVRPEDLTEEEKQQHLQQPFSVGIWVWNGKNWNVAHRCALGDFPVGYKIFWSMGLFQNESLFIHQGYDKAELMLFNCKTGKVENLGIQHDKSSWAKVFPFTVPI